MFPSSFSGILIAIGPFGNYRRNPLATAKFAAIMLPVRQENLLMAVFGGIAHG